MPKDEWIREAYEDQAQARRWLKKLSDEEFAHLDMALRIKELEESIHYKQEMLNDLKERVAIYEKKKLPKVPEKFKYLIQRELKDEGYRFLDKRALEEKLYGYPKGYLTDLD